MYGVQARVDFKMECCVRYSIIGNQEGFFQWCMVLGNLSDALSFFNIHILQLIRVQR